MLQGLVGVTSMKRLLLALGAALLFTVGPISPAHAWGWHHHSGSGPGPAGVGASSKEKRTKPHHEHRSRENATALYNSPKSVGWWQKGSGPMGAGSGETGNMQTARRESGQNDKSAERSTRHGLFSWLHRRNADSNSNATAANPTSGQ